MYNEIIQLTRRLIMNQQQELQGKVAMLESKVDMLESELTYLNHLLIKAGFPKGIHTLKATVEEILSETVFPFHDPLEGQGEEELI